MQIQQIIPGSDEYPNLPILYRGSANRNILCFGSFVKAISFNCADALNNSSFAIFENYATIKQDFTQVTAINYWILKNCKILEFDHNGYSLFTFEWKSKIDKEFMKMIDNYYPSLKFD